MHILITGAAGMIGRKLTERLVEDGGLNGKPIDKLTLIDVVAPKAPAGFSGKVDARALDISGAGDAGRKLIAGRPDVIFHLAAVVSGEAELDFEKGYRINLEGMQHLLEAIRKTGDGYHPKLVFTSSIAVFGAPFPPRDPRRVPSDAAHLLRHAESDGRIAARRLCAQGIPRRRRHPPADHLRAAGQAEQGGVGLLLQHHPRAARRPGGGAAGEGDRDAHACERRARRSASSCTAAALTREQLGPRINLTMPGVCCTVGEQIEALRRVAGDKVVARIRREPDELIMKIVSGWPKRFDAKRALALGFKAEDSFDEIIRVHIEDELGGKIAA